MMDLFKILLIIHIVCGSTSLLLGLFIMLLKKGDRKHTRLGNMYFFSLLTAAAVSLPMSYLHPNYFLFIIGVFTAYMLLTGRNYLKKKSIADVKTIDWVLTFTMLIFGTAFIGFGFYNIIRSNYFGTVFLVFGGFGILFVYQDYLNYRGKSNIKNYWLTTHFQRMIGSYIASVTAFLVVNNTVLPGVVAWLLPSLLMVPLIIKWTRKYKIEINGKNISTLR